MRGGDIAGLTIGVDGYNLAMPRGTGIASYAVELVATLHDMGARCHGIFGLPVPAARELRETAMFEALGKPADPARRRRAGGAIRSTMRAFRPLRPREVPLTAGVEKRPVAAGMPAFDSLTSVGGLFETALRYFRLTGRFVQLRLPDPPAVMHWTYPLPIRLRGSRNVYTLHDVIPLKLPYTTLDNKAFSGRLMAACVASADQVCTVSESSKADIVDRFGIAPDRITNTYQSIALPGGLARDPGDDARTIAGVFGLPHRGYFLYYGAIEPKKNVGRLIEAYLALQTATPLVIVGARAWQSEGELQLMPQGGASGAPGTFAGPCGQTIVRLDYLSRDLLAKLIRGARAVVFPSLYEGFGLPVLEAMQLGTPVITSNTSSLPEVAGDAALLIDPYDGQALREAMRRLDGDAALGEAMARRGIERAKHFTRERYAERLADLYRSAMRPR